MSINEPPSAPAGSAPVEGHDQTALRTSPDATQRPARRVDLLGAWSLVSYTVSGPAGDLDHSLGANPIGMLIYSPQGYMSAQLVDPNHGADQNSRVVGTDPIAAAGQLAYSGPFTVDGTTGRIAHHLLVSSRPDWLHTNQHRLATLHQDQLTLSFTGPDHAGRDRTSTLTWMHLDPQTPR